MHRALLLLCGALALAGCTSEPPTSDVDAQASIGQASTDTTAFALGGVPASLPIDAAPVETVSAGASDFTMIVEETGFQHARLEILTSATVFWWNVDDVSHAIYSDDGRFASSGPIPPGGEFGRTFLTPGEYAYHCAFHPDMKGTVVVLER